MYLSEMRLVTDVVDVFVFLYLYALEVSQVLVIKVILYCRIVAVSQLHSA